MFDKGRILAFHQTSEKYYPGINNIKPGYFFAVLKLIEECGYCFWNEKAEPSKDSAIITFDDGYEDNYDVLLELCRRMITPVVFIPTDYIGKTNSWDYSSSLFKARHLSSAQITKLAGAGVKFGSHGASHRALTKLTPEILSKELTNSKNILEDITGKSVNGLSYPFGRYNKVVTFTALETGYNYGVALDKPLISIDHDSFTLFRTPLYRIDDYFSILSKLKHNSKLETRKNNIINALASGTIITGGRIK
ncbi:MAG: polysaccharide deacetylase family protein [candidate division Zixibacteria bacterium]|nr:polysaccharide deacetylase family protein [candidate division Zixibacteria bacterium]